MLFYQLILNKDDEKYLQGVSGGICINTALRNQH